MDSQLTLRSYKGPDELSYTTDTAWQTIYGQRAVEMTKAPGRGIPPPRQSNRIQSPASIQSVLTTTRT